MHLVFWLQPKLTARFLVYSGHVHKFVFNKNPIMGNQIKKQGSKSNRKIADIRIKKPQGGTVNSNGKFVHFIEEVTARELESRRSSAYAYMRV